MNRDILRQSVNVVAIVATIFVNYLANALPINGKTTGEISDQFEVLFVPAGYVFAIWGLIYLGLIGFAIYQALPSQRENPLLRKVGYLFALSCAANIAWLFLWHYEVFPATVLAMLILLTSLIAIYVRLGSGSVTLSKVEKWLVQFPFSIYLAWITVATISNVAIVLTSIEWSGWGISPVIWTLIMLGVATAITLLASLPRRAIAYMIVIIWAFVGIAIKQADHTTVAVTAWAAAIFIALIAVIAALKNLST